MPDIPSPKITILTKGKYILDENGNPVEERDLLTWGTWFETADRHVALDELEGIKISTVFLGLDHDHDFILRNGLKVVNPHPILWETMIFGGEHDEYQRRYRSKDEAIAGHYEALELVRAQAKDIQELRRMFELSGFEKR